MSECRKFYIFPKHTWGKWKVLTQGRYVYSQNKYKELERECSVCGLKQMTTVDA